MKSFAFVLTSLVMFGVLAAPASACHWKKKHHGCKHHHHHCMR
jgi:hypothetical protein